jgi:hydrogenase-4 component F
MMGFDLPQVVLGWLASAWPPVLLPLLGALVLAGIGSARLGARVAVGVAAVSLAGIVLLGFVPLSGDPGALRPDALNLLLLLPAGVVALGGAVAVLLLPLPEGAGRAWNAATLALLGLTNLALLADDLALAWMALALCGPVLALLVAMKRGAPALAAAWKLVLLCGAASGLGLLGVVVIAMAAQPVAGEAALSFETLMRVAREAEPGPLLLGFLFILAGHGTLAALVPVHLWLPASMAAAPTPLLAIPVALLGNAALHAVLRARAVASLSPSWLPPGALLLAAGLAGMTMAAWMLWRSRDTGRFLAACAIGQSGLAAVGFGLGGPAVMAGVLQMAAALLALGATAAGLDRATRLRGGRGLARLGGLASSDPMLAWALAASLGALAGLPPLAPFVAEFLLVQQAVARLPWLALPLGLALVLLAGATLSRARRLCFGPAPAQATIAAGGRGVLLLMLLHLLALLALGLFLPAPLAALLAEAAQVAP